MTMERNKPTMPVPEAGKKYFGLGRNASYAAAARGEIPTIKIGSPDFCGCGRIGTDDRTGWLDRVGPHLSAEEGRYGGQCALRALMTNGVSKRAGPGRCEYSEPAPYISNPNQPPSACGTTSARP
jgi:hypothetical protein